MVANDLGHACADDDPTGSQSTLESGLRLGLASRWQAVPFPVRDRGLQPEIRGNAGRQLDLWHPCYEGTRPDRQRPGLSLHGG